MSGDDKQSATKVRAGPGLIIAAFCLFLTPVAFGLLYQAGYDEQATERAGEYAGDADNEVAQACRGVPAAEQVICFSNARVKADLQKQDNERNEADLVAQRKTALWTMLMGGAAFVGMALSLVGVILVFRTFEATREANEISRNAQRAWVRLRAFPQLIRPTGLNGLYVRVNFHAENTGATAATHFQLYHRILFRPYGEIDDAIDAEMKAVVEKWRQEHNVVSHANLLPNDCETSEDWQPFKGEEIQWRERPFVGDVAQPMLLAAAICRTVFEPNTLQVSWRSWYLSSFDDKGHTRTYVAKLARDAALGPDDLTTPTYHRSMDHQEHSCE